MPGLGEPLIRDHMDGSAGLDANLLLSSMLFSHLRVPAILILMFPKMFLPIPLLLPVHGHLPHLWLRIAFLGVHFSNCA